MTPVEILLWWLLGGAALVFAMAALGAVLGLVVVIMRLRGGRR